MLTLAESPALSATLSVSGRSGLTPGRRDNAWSAHSVNEVVHKIHIPSFWGNLRLSVSSSPRRLSVLKRPKAERAGEAAGVGAGDPYVVS